MMAFSFMIILFHLGLVVIRNNNMNIQAFDTIGNTDSQNVSNVKSGQTLKRLGWASTELIQQILTNGGEAQFEGAYSASDANKALIWFKYTIHKNENGVVVKNHSTNSSVHVDNMTQARNHIREEHH